MRKTLRATGLSIALSMLVLASPVAAAPPAAVIWDVTFPDSSCPGIDLTQTLTFINRIHTQNPSKEIWTVGSRATITVSGNGKTLSSEGSAAVHIVYNEDGSIARTTVTGLLAAFTVPGQGLVLIDAGVIVFDGELFVSPISVIHGPPMLRFFGPDTDLEAYCAYFAA